MAKKILTREEILNVKDIKQEEVEVSEWGGSVLVQSLSGERRGEVIDTCMNDKGKMVTTKLYPLLLIEGCVEPKFTREDFAAINNKNSGALEKVAQAIMKLSGISKDDLEEAEKNS